MQFDEFVEILKRIVELAEIVKGMQQEKVKHPSSDAGPMPDVVNQYEGLARADDRDTLLRLCGEKGIPVPPRTKTPTLARMLTEHDAKLNGAPPAPAGPPVPPPVDPFSDDDSADIAPPAPPVITVEMVRDALTKVHTAKGLNAVIDILTKFGGGVTKIKEIQEQYYPTVYAEAIK